MSECKVRFIKDCPSMDRKKGDVACVHAHTCHALLRAGLAQLEVPKSTVKVQKKEESKKTGFWNKMLNPMYRRNDANTSG